MATERLYYDDPLLLEFTARVQDVREQARSGAQSTWAIRLDRTAFYPTSGGQPFDTGVLEAQSRSGASLQLAIRDVIDDEHDEVWHLSDKVVELGTEVRGRIDAERRRDHMQQHSGQHLLSAAFIRLCDAPTVSFHLGAEYSTIDLMTSGLSREQLVAVERLVNEVIAEDRPVNVRYASREDALAAGVRKMPEREGTIRLVEMHDFDLNACGGTHVHSTGQVGGLLIRKTEKVKQGIRVEFVCGLRAITTARRDFEALTEAAAQFSSGLYDVPEQVRKSQQQMKVLEKQQLATLEELASYIARELVAAAMPQGGVRVVSQQLQDRDATFAKLLAQKLSRAAEKVFVLVATAQPTPTVVFARSGDVQIDVGGLLRELVTAAGGRGGGSKDLAQGGVPDAALLPQVLRDAEARVRATLQHP